MMGGWGLFLSAGFPPEADLQHPDTTKPRVVGVAPDPDTFLADSPPQADDPGSVLAISGSGPSPSLCVGSSVVEEISTVRKWLGKGDESAS